MYQIEYLIREEIINHLRIIADQSKPPISLARCSLIGAAAYHYLLSIGLSSTDHNVALEIYANSCRFTTICVLPQQLIIIGESLLTPHWLKQSWREQVKRLKQLEEIRKHISLHNEDYLEQVIKTIEQLIQVIND